MLFTHSITTGRGDNIFEITGLVRSSVRRSGILSGICHLVVPHTTAGITVNSCMDPNTLVDLLGEIKRIVPTRVDFVHTFDTPADAAGHIKSTLVGTHVAVIVEAGDLLLGSSQGIFFCEFDGPRERTVYAKLLAG